MLNCFPNKMKGIYFKFEYLENYFYPMKRFSRIVQRSKASINVIKCGSWDPVVYKFFNIVFKRIIMIGTEEI